MSFELTLHLLRIGHCKGPRAMTERSAPCRMAKFPALVALIRHPRHGTILFDTGYGPQFFTATKSFPERIYRWLTPVNLPKAEYLAPQLAALGCPSPDLILLSHLHGDHVAGLFDLPKPLAPILTSQKAIDGLSLGRIASLKAGCPKGLRDALRALPLNPIEACAEIDLADYGMEDFGKGRDVLGDGSVIAIDLPGHGIGQFGLLLPQTTQGAFFLIADAAWSARALRDNLPPPGMVLRRLGDPAAYEQTFARLHALQNRRPDLRLIPSHCGETFDEFNP